jgi:aldose 1-epimerase
VVDRKTAGEVELVASLYEPACGRFMEVWSDQPGIQFYSGNFFDGKVIGKYGRAQNYREAVALETQKFPDSPNQPQFPSTRLNPEETYTQTCIYKFSTKGLE